MNIVLLGKPGSGKGTVSAFLKEQFGLPYLSTGDVFRREIKKGTVLGKIAKELIDKGNFVPDDITINLIRNTLTELKHGFILDGFPRNMEQAHAFDNMLEETGITVDLVLHLNIADDVILKRLVDRQVCPLCSATYHKVNLPPQKEGVCDHCNTDLVVRKDDDPIYMRHRLDLYREKTEPIVHHYQNRGILSTIETLCTVEEMYERVREVVNRDNQN